MPVGTIGRPVLCVVVAAALCFGPHATGQSPAAPAPVLRLDAETWAGAAAGADKQALRLTGDAVYRVPDGPQGSRRVGLATEDDGTLDLRDGYVLRFDIELDRDDVPYRLDAILAITPQTDVKRTPDSTAAHTIVQGKGWHSVGIPVDSFDYNRGQEYFLKFIKSVTLHGQYADESGNGSVLVRNIRFVRGETVALHTAVRSMPADAGATVVYPIDITNTSESPQTCSLSLQKRGWEGFAAEVVPSLLTLKPGETAAVAIKVTVPDSPGIPPGAREDQTLLVTPLGGEQRSAEMVFTTLRRVPAPHLLFDETGWQGVRDKMSRYNWAKEELATVTRRAEQWAVDEVPPGGIKSSAGTPALFKTYEPENNVVNAARAYKLTGNKVFAEKAALFLRRMSDPENGYPKTLHATAGDIPQEGGFFDACANAYDLIGDAGVLSDGDRKQIEASLRLYVYLISNSMGDGGISNWAVFNLAPAVKCALVLQDLERVDRLLNGPGGLVDHLRFGQMDDGWWYEMSLSYNLGCAAEYTSVGLALRPFGDDFLNRHFPVAATNKVGLRPFEFQNLLGMAFGKYGPVRDNFVSVKKFWDGITAYPDYRGVMFGMGDGHEQAVSGNQFELAYYAFRDPAYAAVIKQGGHRDLVLGVPELPEKTPELFKVTAKSDNAGVAVLRSQTPGRPIAEQIQAVMKYGTHGSYHGHFDRLSLLSLMRYGRSFYNPETSWFGYTSYMYKWWVQTSVSHNMVVVDGKMQAPSECRPLLFHSGPMLQAVGAETTTRWSNPPYFGGYDQLAKVRSGDVPFVPIPNNHPAVGELTGYTEPIRQRRVMVTTDDYVVLVDALRAENEHVFDHLTHLRGAAIPPQPNVQPAGTIAQLDASPLSSGQFVTGCEQFKVTAPALIESIHRIGKDEKNLETGGADSLSVPGTLHIDERVLWPAESDVIIGRYAESWRVNKKLTYDVSADGKPLAGGTFGAWILGSGAVDVDITGVKKLTLTTRVQRDAKALKTVFWGDARIVTADGRELPLSTLAVSTDNVLPAPAAGKDYEGGPVRISGVTYAVSTAAEPTDADKPAVVMIDLTGITAVRFKATVGGDWPVGDEQQVRKTVAVRSRGKAARFLTLLEPFEDRRQVVRANATGPDGLRVELADGRVQELTISGLSDENGPVKVTLRETAVGREPKTESATGMQSNDE